MAFKWKIALGIPYIAGPKREAMPFAGMIKLYKIKS